MQQNICLSIITVNYNSGVNFKKTLSMLGPYAKNTKVELIVIDGGSTDCSLSDAGDFKGFITTYISEKDDGIFDAMNKGIKYSRGKWLWFINSGDIPNTSHDKIEELINEAEKVDANLIFSDLLLRDVIISQKLSIGRLLFSMLNHQNIIYHKSLLEDGYDATFKYCADYHHLLNNYKYIKPYKSNYILCKYDVNGVSSTLSRKIRVKLWNERLRAQIKANIGFPVKIFLISFSLIIILIKLINPRVGSKIHSYN
jgi:glycosyltransferase involved in cell wall biosynthesis